MKPLSIRHKVLDCFVQSMAEPCYLRPQYEIAPAATTTVVSLIGWGIKELSMPTDMTLAGFDYAFMECST